MAIQNQKSQLRQYYSSIRRAISTEQQARAAHQLALRVIRHPWYKRAKSIAFYWPTNGEISPLPLLRIASRQQKACYLPRLIDARHMLFHRYRPGEPLHYNRFSIKEPAATRPQRRLQDMDLVILPLLAFDQRGTRLGMGGGFYDRALQRRSPPMRLGIAHDLQRAQRLPRDRWDIPLHGIATEKRFITPK